MASPERKQIGARIHEWRTDRGSIRSERLRSDVLLFKLVGHLELELAELFVERVDEAVAESRPHVFWDGEAMTSYDSEFRQRVGRHCVARKDQVVAFHVYTPSPLVAMGAAVVNVWLGGSLRVSKTRADFDARVADASRR